MRYPAVQISLFDKKVGAVIRYSTVAQTIAGQNKTVWPKGVATASFVYPKPDWTK